MLGGTGAINEMLYLRGNEHDYDSWKSFGNSEWGWTDVLPYFKKSESNHNFAADNTEYHSSSGEVKVELFLNAESMKNVVMDAGKEKGYEFVSDINADTKLGYTFAQGMQHQGTRQTVAKSFLLKERPNLHIIKYAHVTKVELNKDGVATGVEFLYNGTQLLTAYTRKEVILSAGPIATPQLLMLSGVGPEKQLTKFEIPLKKALAVGRNLQDQLVVPLFFQMHKDEAQQMTKSELLDSIYLYALHKMGPLASHSASDLTAFLNTVNHTGYPDVQLRHTLYRKNAFDLQFYLTISGYEEMIGRQILDLNKMGDVLVVYVGLLKPTSKGYIKLRSSDPADKPKLYSNYLDKDEDVETLVRALKFQADYIKTKSFESHQGILIRLPLAACKSMEYQSDEYWRCYASYMTRSMNHQVGTTKMGPSTDKTAVVDSRLRVHGLKRLRVVGSSVMPTTVSAQSNAPTIMIAEKAADFIKEDWQYKPTKDEL